MLFIRNACSSLARRLMMLFSHIGGKKKGANITRRTCKLHAARIRTLRANSPDYDSICVNNIRLHLHICIFACMQIVPRENCVHLGIYTWLCARENDDAKRLIAAIGRTFLVHDTSKQQYDIIPNNMRELTRVPFVAIKRNLRSFIAR